AIVSPIPSIQPASAPDRKQAPETRPRTQSLWRRWLSPGMGFAFGAAAAALVLYALFALPARTQNERLAANLKDRDSQVARANVELNSLKETAVDSAKLQTELSRLRSADKEQ